MNYSYTFLFILSILGLLIGLFLYVTIRVYLMRRKYRHIPGPPTKGIVGFYFGHTFYILNYTKQNKPLADLLVQWRNEYGNTYKYQMFLSVILLTIDKSSIRVYNFCYLFQKIEKFIKNLNLKKDILIEKNYPKNPIIYGLLSFPFGARLFGHAIGTELDEQKWKMKRTLLNPLFHRQSLMESINEFNIKGDLLLQKLRKSADGKTCISLFDELNGIALDIIATVAFGIQTETIDDPNIKLHKAVGESFEAINKLIDDPFFQLRPSEWNFLKEYRQTVEKLRDFCRKVITNRAKLIEEDSYVPNDMLTTLIKNTNISDVEEIVDEIIGFFIAGQETTAATTSLCLLELGKNPSVFQKIREELDDVLGARNEVKFEDVPKFNYLSCVIKESLRLYPAIAYVHRITPNDCKIDGYDVPKGAWLTVSPYVCARNPDYYSDPYEFKPERHLIDENKEETKMTFFPFSLGPRNCLGLNFALIEMKVILAKFIKNFDFELDPNQNFAIVQRTSIRPLDGVKSLLKLRHF